MKTPILKLENIRKAFNGNLVLDNINLELFEGEIFGLIGSSGSGKTTLLNTMVGFLVPDSGSVFFRDERVLEATNNSQYRAVLGHMEYVKRHFGFAAQRPSFYEKLTVFENLDYFGSLYDLGKEARLTNINTLLDLVELDKARDIGARNLSGGMQRRLDIACALIHDPDILFLDEPTSDLDPVLAKNIWQLLQKINKRGTTIIVASHHLDDLETVCSRIGIIAQGKLDNVGSIGELTALLSKGQEIKVETYPGNYDKIASKLQDKLITEKKNLGNQLVITTPKPDKVLSKLINVLNDLDETLIDLKINRLKLSDVFSKVTKKK